MPADRDPIDDESDRFAAIERQLTEIAHRIGHGGSHPKDPDKAMRSEMPLYWHFFDLRDSLDSLQTLRGVLQVMTGLVEQLGRKLDRNASISEANAAAIGRLAEISRSIATSARLIEENIVKVAREKPLLMRDVYWSETEAVEIGLFVVTGFSSIFFAIASEAFLRSPMFRSMSIICDIPGIWALCAGLLAISGIAAYASRLRRPRRVMACAEFVFYAVTGVLQLINDPGVLDTIHHLVFASSAFWVASRGPSNAL